MSTRKEKMRIFRSLVSLVKGLEYKYTLIDLRNDASVIGYIQQVDGFMNVLMEDVVFVNPRGDRFLFDSFFVQSRNIRYVHVPEDMSIINTIENSFNKLKKHKPEKDKMSVKQKRLMKNQVETLAKLHDTSSNIA